MAEIVTIFRECTLNNYDLWHDQPILNHVERIKKLVDSLPEEHQPNVFMSIEHEYEFDQDWYYVHVYYKKYDDKELSDAPNQVMDSRNDAQG